MPVTAPFESLASHQLGNLLDAGGAAARRLKAEFHWTVLWRLRAGKCQPRIDTAVQLRRLTGGAIKLDSWAVPKKPARKEKAPSPTPRKRTSVRRASAAPGSSASR